MTVTFGNLVGYVHKDHLTNNTDTLAKYTKGATFTAVVMYTLPLVNAVYLTLKSTILNPDNTIEVLPIGQTSSATIIGSTSAGLFVHVSTKLKGFVPLRHLSDNQDVFEDIEKLFPVNGKKKCRILSHALLDDVYICTFKK